MKICLATPAGPGSRSGNQVTTVRWARILRQLGHHVQVIRDYSGERADMLIAIHAWRTADAIRQFRARHPSLPIVVLLAGTDIYRFQHSEPETTLGSMTIADRLVGLHDLVCNDIPAQYAAKLRIIRQSSLPLPAPRKPLKRYFQVCVVGHLRDEKDSLRTALAARHAPAASKLRVIQLGKAHNDAWAQAARDEQDRNPRYFWRGEVSPGEVRRVFSQSHAMVMSSVMEGGANVVSEAIVTGLPVIASDISGNRGLLGDEHPAYFPARDEVALAQLLLRAESDPDFLGSIASHAARKAPLFKPELEAQAWQALLDELR